MSNQPPTHNELDRPSDDEVVFPPIHDQALYRGFTQDSDSIDIPREDGLGFPIYPAMPVFDERLSSVLRVLGRLEMMDHKTIFLLCYQGRYARNTMHRDLAVLRQHKLIWRTYAPSLRRTSYKNQTFKPTGRRRYVYGLTSDGKELLRSIGAEENESDYARLHDRDIQARYPSPSTMGHDLQVSWWCGSIVEGLRLFPWCVSVFIATEYSPDARQFIDALVIARFDLAHPRQDRSRLPWWDGGPRRPGQFDIRWALELDRGTESSRILHEKFNAYRQLHKEGIYARHLGGDITMVLIVQSIPRASLLATHFREAWPGGWGLVSTSGAGGAASPHGVLWGRYLTLADAKPVPLLATLERNRNREVIGYHPLISRKQWTELAGNPDAPLEIERPELIPIRSPNA